MKILRTSKTTRLVLMAVLLFTACHESGRQAPTADTRVKAAASPAPTQPGTEVVRDKATEAAPFATITTPAYVARIYQAIAFVPKNDGMGLMKIKPGHRYVVLDMSVQNTTKEKQVDMGQILLATRVRDEKGREYRMNAMAIAAYTLSNPNPQHQAQYNALWGKLKPGDLYRTTVFGMEVPEGVKKFVISMREDGDVLKDSKRHEAPFSVE